MVSETMDKVTFQTDMNGSVRRLNRTDYVVFEERQDNGVFEVTLSMQVKAGYVRKSSPDLLKNDHIIFQKRGNYFFFLFEALKASFQSDESGSESFQESGRNSDYQYKITIKKNASVPEADDEPVSGADASIKRINKLLQDHGLAEVEESSPVTEFMKTWKLGHPDES